MTDEHSVTSEEPQPAETPGADVGAGAPEPEAPDASEGAASAKASSASASEAWGEVLTALGNLGVALSTWASAAANEPDNRRHLDELRTGVNEMARHADEVIKEMQGSEFGAQFAEGAQHAGEAIGGAAAEISQAAAPHVATAFAGLADVFGRAAQAVSESVAAADAKRPTPQPPSSSAAVDDAEDAEIIDVEPAAPAAEPPSPDPGANPRTE